MPEIKLCLKCGKNFRSTGNGNRICDNCNKRNKQYKAPVPGKKGQVIRKEIEDI